MKPIEVDGKTLRLQVWDTAGQERFRTITQSYYKGTHAIILCYDSTNRTSFVNVENWLKQIENHASSEVVLCLIATKSDINDYAVSPQEGEELA